MAEPVTIMTLILAAITALSVFMKGIKKCNCTNRGIELERCVDNSSGLEKQQEFTINLMKILHELSNTSKHGTTNQASSSGDVSNPDKSPAELKRNMKELLKILDDQTSNANNQSIRNQSRFRGLLRGENKNRRRREVNRALRRTMPISPVSHIPNAYEFNMQLQQCIKNEVEKTLQSISQTEENTANDNQQHNQATPKSTPKYTQFIVPDNQ